MRFLFSLFFVVLIIASGVAVVVFSTAEQGAPGTVAAITDSPASAIAEQSSRLLKKLASFLPANVPVPWPSSPAAASPDAAIASADKPPQPPVTVLKGQPIGDWVLNCGVNPQTIKKQCTISQQLTDEKSKSVVFAWLIGNDGSGNLVAIWQTPIGILVNRGVVVNLGEEKPVSVPFTSCVTGHCEAVANLAPDFIQTLARATSATATVYTVAGQGLTFKLSVNGLAQAIDAVKAPTAS
ncbi:MAG: invasion associated locus B family protein [Bauldia sp.]